MDTADIRNQLLDELIDQMETSLADKMYPSEKPKETEEPSLADDRQEKAGVVDTKETTEEEPKEETLSDEDMAALEAVQGE